MTKKPKQDEELVEGLVEEVLIPEVILDGANTVGVFAPSLQGTSYDPSRRKE